MSRSISWPQATFAFGGVDPPPWFTFRKQPFALVQAGSPNRARYALRSASAFGLSYASTIATVWPFPTQSALGANGHL